MPGEQRCTAPEYAVVNFLQKELSPHDFLSFRSDFLDDKKSQRRYPGFESLLLHHAVWAAEISRLYSPRDQPNMPVFRDNSSINRTTENGLLSSEVGHCRGFSLGGRCAVRFQ